MRRRLMVAAASSSYITSCFTSVRARGSPSINTYHHRAFLSRRTTMNPCGDAICSGPVHPSPKRESDAVFSVSRGMESDTGSGGVLEFLESLKNYEKLGVPKGAGTESADGFDLARMHRLLSALGEPHFRYPAIHVAGTKGKGSTAAFISNILRAQGYFVGSYTSPHILSIHERIIAGKTEVPITPVAFQNLFEDNRKIIEAQIKSEQGALTYFEVLTALAYQYFAQVNVDIAIIEAGLGGARDATNVIPTTNLAVAVITNIGKEHLAALGGSLETIALAKSGIIKQGRPVILGGPLDPKIEGLIRQVADSKQSKVICAFGEGIHCKVEDIKLDADNGGAVQCCNLHINPTRSEESLNWNLDNKCLQLQMVGSHQLNNATTAICAILCLRDQGWIVEDDAIWSGLKKTHAIGRFQVMSKAASMKTSCNPSTLVLDGAHTGTSAKVLASTLKMVFSSEPLALVVAMASDKDHVEFCAQLLSGAAPRVVVVTEVMVAGCRLRSTPACVLADCLNQAAKLQNKKVIHEHAKDEIKDSELDSYIIVAESESIVCGIKKASELLHHVGQKGVICVTGSLHAVSEVLSYLMTN